ncbi:MAG: HEAT repeat domain-containing protein [Myxococcota bacterium]
MSIGSSCNAIIGARRIPGRRRRRSAPVLRALVAAFVATLLLLDHRPAQADKIDRLINQLRGNKAYKIRLSAAINLAKLSEPRVILAFINALRRDKDQNIRSLAATTLGKKVDGSTGKGLRKRAIKALTAATEDSSPLVRERAQAALDALKAAFQ